jgi:hypothetical protein
MTNKTKNKLWAALTVLIIVWSTYSILGIMFLLGWKAIVCLIGAMGVYKLWKIFYDEMNEKDGIQ